MCGLAKGTFWAEGRDNPNRKRNETHETLHARARRCAPPRASWTGTKVLKCWGRNANGATEIPSLANGKAFRKVSCHSFACCAVREDPGGDDDVSFRESPSSACGGERSDGRARLPSLSSLALLCSLHLSTSRTNKPTVSYPREKTKLTETSLTRARGAVQGRVLGQERPQPGARERLYQRRNKVL